MHTSVSSPRRLPWCGREGPAPGKHTGPEPVGRLLARHPRLLLIVAHMGTPEYTDFLDRRGVGQQGDARLPGPGRAVRRGALCTTLAFADFSERFHPFPGTERGRLADLGDRILLGSGVLASGELLEMASRATSLRRPTQFHQSVSVFSAPSCPALGSGTATLGYLI